MHTKSLTAMAVVPLAALALAGCATGGSAGDGASEVDGPTIVASTNVYGDIAKRVAGSDANVTSIVNSAAQDPHSYEASAQDQLAISRADIIIENGGGYDPFIDTLREAAGNTDAITINVSELSGLMPGSEPYSHDHDGADGEGAAHAEHGGDDNGHDHVEGFNEHVWYSFDAADALAHELAHVLGEAKPAAADAFHDNYDAFAADITKLDARADAIAADASGRSAAITEPVPLYLLERVGLTNVTPDEFSEAVEEGTDVSPAVLKQTLDVIAAGDVALLAYNEQTSGPETDKVADAARAAGVPVVDFTETLPENAGYIDWMSTNLDAVSKAIAR